MHDLPQARDHNLPTLKIVIASLIGAVIIFMVMAVLLFPFGKGDVPGGKPVLVSYVALAVSLLALLVIRPLVLTAMTRSASGIAEADEAESESHLSQWFHRYTITEHAMLEAMAFLNLTAYIIERQIWSLLVTTPIILWMVYRFPNRDRANRWFEDHAGDDKRA